MLAATQQIDIFSILLFGCVLALGWFVDAQSLRINISQRLIFVLMLAYLPFSVVDWRILGFPLIVVLIHFIFFASSFKLLQPKRRRDWLWLYVISFFEMLLAAGMMIDTTFFVLLIFFLFFAVSTLVNFELQRAAEDLKEQTLPETTATSASSSKTIQTSEIEYWKETSSERRWLKPPRWQSVAVFSGLSLTLIVVLATPLFLAMPRMSWHSQGNGWWQGTALSGFSESVRLGEVAQVKLNRQVVMRVRVTQPPEAYRAQLRWRGVTFDHYDGHTWSDSGKGRARFMRPRGGDSVVLGETDAPTKLTQQTFYLEPLDTSTIFAASRPIVVTGLGTIWKDESDSLWTHNHAFNRLVYVVESDARVPRDSELREDNARVYPSEILTRYTQLPENRDRRIDHLAAEITQGVHTTADIAYRIENHLRSAYSYSLNLTRTDEDDPVADFLFNTRAGHCEYFATSMTLLLRARGIPARLVNGFQMGEYSALSDSYTVRQSDAHSWVEVYFPKHGWVTFDPTPPAGQSNYETGWLAVLRSYGDAVEMFWLEHIIDFGTNEQVSMVFSARRWMMAYRSEVGEMWDRFKERITSALSSVRDANFSKLYDTTSTQGFLRNLISHPAALCLYGISAIFGAIFYFKRRRNSWQHRINHDAAGSAIAFYQEMLVSLERAGHKRAISQTPHELAAHIALPQVSEITRQYERVRFGSTRLNEDEVRQITALLNELKQIKSLST